ncbi:MAG: type I 3-dehydroquinate dehydratase, partial [Leptonema sp. (in: bacteria)]
GGKIKVKEELRKEIIVDLIKKYHKYIDFVDIEYNSKIKKEIKKILKKYDKNLIISLHIFKSEPTMKKIKIILKDIKKFINFGKNKNLIKIVIKSDNFKYYFNILKELYKTKNLKKTTFFTIGKISLISRIIGIILKMPLIYVATKKPVVSTQPDIKQIIKYLSKIGFLN